VVEMRQWLGPLRSALPLLGRLVVGEDELGRLGQEALEPTLGRGLETTADDGGEGEDDVGLDEGRRQLDFARFRGDGAKGASIGVDPAPRALGENGAGERGEDEETGEFAVAIEQLENPGKRGADSSGETPAALIPLAGGGEDAGGGAVIGRSDGGELGSFGSHRE